MGPEIPEKFYFGIREVAKLCDVEPTVLRYWEKQFEALSPQKRANGRRHYTREHILLVRHIKRLLYVEGFTVSGAKQQLREGHEPKEFAHDRMTSVLQDVVHRLTNVYNQLTESVE
jgi:DNA-binding transcriptional MerR regulator